MNGVTIREAGILLRALDGLKYDLERNVLPPQYDKEVDEDLDHIVALQEDIQDFLRRVKETNSTLEIWTDGAARPTNPGPAGIGVVGKMAGRTVLEVAEYIGRTTNNVAEYKATVEALRRAVDIGARHVVLHTDSKLVVQQFEGVWQCKDDTLQPLLGRLRGLATRFESFTIKWIPRARNREADGLSVAGAYKSRDCGACRHEWHTAFCTVTDDNTGLACGCPYGFRGGIDA